MFVKIVDEDDFYYEEIYLNIDPCSEYLVIETGDLNDIFPFANQIEHEWYQSNSDFSQNNPVDSQFGAVENRNQISGSNENKIKKKKGLGSRFKRLFGKKK